MDTADHTGEKVVLSLHLIFLPQHPFSETSAKGRDRSAEPCGGQHDRSMLEGIPGTRARVAWQNPPEGSQVHDHLYAQKPVPAQRNTMISSSISKR